MNRIIVDTEGMEQISLRISQIRQSITKETIELTKVLSGIHAAGFGPGSVRDSLYDHANDMKALALKCERFAKSVKNAAGILNSCEQALKQKIIPEAPKVLPKPNQVGKKAPPGTKKEYYDMIKDRAQNAVDPETRKLYDKFVDRLKIANDDYVNDGKKNQAYYDSRQNRVYLNWEHDSINEQGAGSTYFHEVGHMVDDYTNIFGLSSSSKPFTKALKTDFENYISKTMAQSNMTREEAYDHVSEWLMIDCDNKAGVSDLMGGLSNNECIGRWGHFPDKDGNEYWTGSEHGVPSKLNNEAIAGFFEASMSEDSKKLDYLKEVFPTAHKEYKKIIREKLK